MLAAVETGFRTRLPTRALARATAIRAAHAMQAPKHVDHMGIPKGRNAAQRMVRMLGKAADKSPAKRGGQRIFPFSKNKSRMRVVRRQDGFGASNG